MFDPNELRLTSVVIQLDAVVDGAERREQYLSVAATFKASVHRTVTVFGRVTPVQEADGKRWRNRVHCFGSGQGNGPGLDLAIDAASQLVEGDRELGARVAKQAAAAGLTANLSEDDWLAASRGVRAREGAELELGV